MKLAVFVGATSKDPPPLTPPICNYGDPERCLGASGTPLLTAVGSTRTADLAESVHILFHFLQQGELLTPPAVPASPGEESSW